MALISSFMILGGHLFFSSLLYCFWAVLDCLDGSLARVLKSKYGLDNKYGRTIDAFGGYFLLSTLWPSLGFYAFYYIGSYELSLCCFMISIFSLLGRLFLNKLKSDSTSFNSPPASNSDL